MSSTGQRKAQRKAQPPAQPAPAEGVTEATSASPADAPAAAPAWAGWERLIRVFGVLVSVIAAFASGVLELFLTTFRAGDLISVWRGDAIGSGGGPLIGVSVLLAIAGNLGIAWFAVSTTGRRWALGPPWALWTLLMLFASGVHTAEGDYLLAGTNYVALAMILIGSLAYAIFAYRMILRRIPPRADAPRN